MNILVAAFYHFTRLEDCRPLQSSLQALCRQNGIRGTILLAGEGINGTIAGERDSVQRVLHFLRQDPRLADLQHKASWTDRQPFLRMKVRLKKEIVALGVPGIDPHREAGTYVAPEQWNDLISDPDVVVIDTRNDYEYAIGTFTHAINPETGSFRDFPGFVKQNLDPGRDKKIAMFCTGGIRCEKATAYMLQQGFKEVYHLQGGILNYLETVNPDHSLWQGECFVFDERVSVDHRLMPGHYELCHGCRHPITEEDKLSPFYNEGVACPYCHASRTQKQRRAAAERQRQIVLAKSRGQLHLGSPQQRATKAGKSGRN